MKHLYPLLLIAVIQLSSCSYSAENQAIPISKASIFPIKSSKVESSVAFIYDYNIDRLKLEWTACKIVKSSGDQLLDALNAFLEKNEKKGICKFVEFQGIDLSKQPVIISFSGKPTFKNKKEQKIFLTALDMTISRNLKQDDFEITFL